MQIKPLSNNNISHKAYFKQNKMLKTICNSAEKNKSTLEFMDFFKKDLPNHELEIINKITPNNTNNVIYKIMNNTTCKVQNFAAGEGKQGLQSLLAGILLWKDDPSFWSKDVDNNTDCFKFLTNEN